GDPETHSLAAHDSRSTLDERLHAIPKPRLEGLEQLQPGYPGQGLQQTETAGARNTLLTQQQERLNSYGWVNQQDGIAHIPSTKAMQLMLQRNRLPARPAESATRSQRPGSRREPQ